ncbi:hypothetical protein [Paenisporosarcina sp. NPDC076898]|uniref:hypothetical protein n=1 Tax=unclassified Paenisporosarcina TaxID=2642018 RepID=UPI003CFDA129
MKIINIEYPTALSKILNIKDDNVDVFVELDDGYTYNLVVSTPKNLETEMSREKSDYISPGQPMVFVKELTEENIRKALESYLEYNAYWLKLYYLAGEFDLDTFAQMLNRIKTENEEIF